MKILLVAASKNEIAPFVLALETLQQPNNSIDILISGAGMVNTTFHLTRQLVQQNYDWVINAGIGGCFCKEIPIGTLLNVTQDQFSELGVDTERGFELFPKNTFLKEEETAFSYIEQKYFHPAIDELKKVNGITVNTVNGNPEKIAQLERMFSPCVESMEGAAVFYVCKQMQANCLQLRSISNYVEKRNLNHWNIPLAIGNLNDFLIHTLLQS